MNNLYVYVDKDGNVTGSPQTWNTPPAGWVPWNDTTVIEDIHLYEPVYVADQHVAQLTKITDHEYAQKKILEQIRAERNQLLLETDWTQIPDSPLSDAEREQYRRYRQALRDLPQKFSSVANADGIQIPELSDF